ncbi:MAG: alpha/beta hydrolase [Chloroflexi bacterium]|jgi:pimeloyl-ACP methyl ester carboxylesterase|nr:alpha/beta hydrolase [Chloroflexota bacterium]MBT3668673.1 alpha/beta hydrolase [Chloroflexota bacterium]MBT4003705.1 alpha/beta hydrolase [Chloroflexota bacterium]MBT4305374.1 alpha/beta hydrolase [Chloroflexota bacterium]MBT4532520.1 alpha/beta hydrolase [Chloroflexota bacterium]
MANFESHSQINGSNGHPPKASFGDVQLPNTHLHYVTCGEGEPLIIVPATVSLIEQWMPLAQFMGQRYKSYFFEMPGHGKSTPYPFKFNSSYVPQTVEAFADAMGIEKFTLMGFSFGGLLAMRTLEHLEHRINKVILLSPLLSQETLKYQNPKRWIIKTGMNLLKNSKAQQTAHQIMNSNYFEKPLMYAVSKITNVEQSILKSKNALKIPISTLDVFAHTVGEIFEMEYKNGGPPSEIPCFFGMSIYDDMIDFGMTESIVKKHFKNLTMQKFFHPYHQPPEPPTFDWLVNGFDEFLSIIK